MTLTVYHTVSGDANNRDPKICLHRPYPYAGVHTATYQRGAIRGVLEREKCIDDIRQTRESEVQIGESPFLV